MKRTVVDTSDHDLNLIVFGFCPNRNQFGEECTRCKALRATKGHDAEMRRKAFKELCRK